MTHPVSPFSWTGFVDGNLCSADIEWVVDFEPLSGYPDQRPTITTNGRFITVSAGSEDEVSPGVLMLTPTVHGPTGDVVLEPLVLEISLTVQSGDVWAWGSGSYYRLGTNSLNNYSTPVATLNASETVAVACGNEHSLALKADGTVLAWGRNNLGQLGIGEHSSGGIPLYTQVTSPWLLGLSGIAKIATGTDHSLALQSNGQLWAWGANGVGALGDGTTTNKLSPVLSLIDGVVDISAGGPTLNAGAFSLALKGDGTVWAWGRNNNGQLGDGGFTNRQLPAQVPVLSGIASVSAGSLTSAAIGTGGELWLWGSNSGGQLGDGTLDHRASPYQVPSLTNVTSVGVGALHTAVVRSDGSVWTCGSNTYGQLGIGASTSTVQREFVQVPDIAGVREVVCGRHHTLAVKTDGSVVAWGDNNGYQIGVGGSVGNNTPFFTTPVTVSIDSVMNAAAGTLHSLVVRRTE